MTTRQSDRLSPSRVPRLNLTKPEGRPPPGSKIPVPQSARGGKLQRGHEFPPFQRPPLTSRHSSSVQFPRLDARDFTPRLSKTQQSKVATSTTADGRLDTTHAGRTPLTTPRGSSYRDALVTPRGSSGRAPARSALPFRTHPPPSRSLGSSIKGSSSRSGASLTLPASSTDNPGAFAATGDQQCSHKCTGIEDVVTPSSGDPSLTGCSGAQPATDAHDAAGWALKSPSSGVTDEKRSPAGVTSAAAAAAGHQTAAQAQTRGGLCEPGTAEVQQQQERQQAGVQEQLWSVARLSQSRDLLGGQVASMRHMCTLAEQRVQDLELATQALAASMDQLSLRKHAVDGQREEARATLLALMLAAAQLADAPLVAAAVQQEAAAAARPSPPPSLVLPPYPAPSAAASPESPSSSSCSSSSYSSCSEGGKDASGQGQWQGPSGRHPALSRKGGGSTPSGGFGANLDGAGGEHDAAPAVEAPESRTAGAGGGGGNGGRPPLGRQGPPPRLKLTLPPSLRCPQPSPTQAAARAAPAPTPTPAPASAPASPQPHMHGRGAGAAGGLAGMGVDVPPRTGAASATHRHPPPLLPLSIPPSPQQPGHPQPCGPPPSPQLSPMAVQRMQAIRLKLCAAEHLMAAEVGGGLP